MIAFGLISAVLGIVAISYPGVTLLVVSIVIGINIIVLSIADLVESALDHAASAPARVLSALLGLLGLIAGIIVLRHPGRSLAVLILAIGLYLVVAGAVHAFRALSELTADRARRALLGIAELSIGVLILAIPGIGLVTLAAFAAAGMLVRGLGAIWLGLQFLKPPAEA
jgi:uncharacterized membrane protein HdeD (DUF308 family)